MGYLTFHPSASVRLAFFSSLLEEPNLLVDSTIFEMVIGFKSKGTRRLWTWTSQRRKELEFLGSYSLRLWQAPEIVIDARSDQTSLR